MPLKSLLFSILFLSFYSLLGQTTPLATRNISGIIRDSLNKPVAEAEIRLTSIKDTVKTTTNQYGFWGFKNIKSAEFLLSVRALGYTTFHQKYFNNDTKPQINIPPIQLGIKVEQLKTVTINRLKGPTIKKDTTEFWAKDYIVRDFARLEDLLKRMEGITIDSEGSVFYNGERVVKALFNSKQYFNGSVKEAMKELPADIVERIQIIDMDQTGTGAKNLKSDASVKVMNIVTKRDKSAGKMYDLTLEQGTESRTRANSKIRKIDGANQFSTNLGYKQEPQGIRPTPIPGSLSKQTGMFIRTQNANVTEGLSKEINAGLSKSYKLKTINLSSDLQYLHNKNWNSTNTVAENYYEQGTLYQKTNDYSQTEQNNINLNNNFNGQLKNQATITGNLNFNFSAFDNFTLNEAYQTGVITNIEKELSTQKGEKFNYNYNSQYRKALNDKLQYNLFLSSNFENNNTDEISKTNIFKTTSNNAVPDSTLNQLRVLQLNDFRNTASNELTWTKNERFKFKTSVNLSSHYNLRDIKSSIIEKNQITFQNDLSSYQSYHNFKIPLNIATEYNFKNGITINPSLSFSNEWLNGKINMEKATIQRYDFIVNPNLSIRFTNSKIGTVRGSISQNSSQPAITQLNPNPYYISPYNISIGNPNLKNTSRTNFGVSYSKFFKKMQINTSLNALIMYSKKTISSNRFLEIDSNKNTITTTTTFINIDGQKSQNINFDLSKTLSKINSSINLKGAFLKNQNPYMNNGTIENRNSLSQKLECSFFYNFRKWLEITTGLQYDNLEDDNSASKTTTYNRLFSANLNLGFYFGKSWNINANISQAISSTTNIDNKISPFVLNMNIEKRIFKKNNGIISFVVMDLARQNYLTNYKSNDYGYSQTLTNKNSQYYLLQFSWQPQSWGKSKNDTGQRRKGNGSFIDEQ